MGADVLGVAAIDMLPDVFHVVDFGGVVEMLEEFLLEVVGGGAGEDAGNVHVGIAGAGEAEVDDADHLVVLVEEDVAEVEVAVDELIGLGLFDVGVVGVDVVVVVFVVELF